MIIKNTSPERNRLILKGFIQQIHIPMNSLGQEWQIVQRFENFTYNIMLFVVPIAAGK